MYVSFEIAALFPSLYSRVTNRSSDKTRQLQKQTFIWTPSSHSYIILALARTKDYLWNWTKYEWLIVNIDSWEWYYSMYRKDIYFDMKKEQTKPWGTNIQYMHCGYHIFYSFKYIGRTWLVVLLANLLSSC